MKKAKAQYTIVFILAIIFSVKNNYAQNNNSMKIPKGVIVHKDILYSKTPEKDLLLDLYIPEKTNNSPLVVWIHGGAWKGGSKEKPGHAIRLIEEGFAVASINYRLSQEAIFPAQIIDCKSAIRWLRANAEDYGYNPEKIGVWGSSAGGHLVALLGTSGEVDEWNVGENLNQSSQVQAVCDWYDPTDFLKMDDAPGDFAHLSEDSPESQLIGEDIRDNPQKVKKANPITYVNGNEPPFLIMHGKVDKTVIHEQSILLNEALKNKNGSVELILLDDLGHGGKKWREQVPTVTSFFKKCMNN